MGVYQPMYIFFYLIILGILYIPVALYALSKFKLNVVGILLVLLSVAGYVLIGVYMVGAGIYADEQTSRILSIGFPELLLLSYPYILIGLAVVLGKKGERY